jgi:hypothetical protein
MSEPQITWGAGLTPDELAARLKAHPFAAVREPLMQRITFVALGHSQPLTPVRTGTLRRSETTRVEPGGLKGYLGSNIKYAPFVHARVPFFKQGIEESRAEAQRLLEESGDAYLEGLIS